ncbi:MAG: class I SAM-dependent methyltransferase [Patescibacteria group bacterium]|jgi:SAM-dependent methyltransferase
MHNTARLVFEWTRYLREQHVGVVDFHEIPPYLEGSNSARVANLVGQFPELKGFLEGMRNGFRIPPEVAKRLPDIICWDLIGCYMYSEGIFYRSEVEISFLGTFLETFSGGRGTVLDIGCGTGHRLNFLSSRGIVSGQCIGIDFDKSLLAKAKAQAKREKAKVEYVAGDCRSLPLPSESIDYAYAFFLLSWVDNWKKVILEACRVLKRGGVVYISNCCIECRNPIEKGSVAQYLQELHFLDYN